MGPVELNKRRIFILIAAVFSLTILYTGLPSRETVSDGFHSIPIPGIPHQPHLAPGQDPDEAWDPDTIQRPPPRPYVIPESSHDTATPPPKEEPASTTVDLHPIRRLMEEADLAFRAYEGGASQTFRQTVDKYRSKYGRHPPPGFREWYVFARKRNVVNIDDFEHIMDDLRPFWTMEPKIIRSLAAHMWEDEGHGAAGIHIRNHKVGKINFGSWRSETFENVLKTFIEYLPDMDIAMNRLDQPRVVVPYEDLQKILEKEASTRVMHPEAMDSFTSNQTNLLDLSIEDKKNDNSTREDAGWFNYAGKQYMDVAAKACPPDSPARRNYTLTEADALYKEPTAGLVTNFNLSSDLCTVGPVIKNLHGLLYSASSMLPTHKLVPIFGECKTNINNDILFPANMYYLHDSRYDYDPTGDVDWRDKADTMIWRGVTSGGVQTSDNWDRMHRQRLVQLANGTWTDIHKKIYPVLTTANPSQDNQNENTTYTTHPSFHPNPFTTTHTDIGFVESWGCVPNCDFYSSVFSWKDQTTLTSQFKSRYLIDVDGHSFSGRWHAFLQSKSLGFKATIFREWHDSRLFAWRHFVPVDNRYEELYALLTYFIGYDGSKANTEATTTTPAKTPAEAYVEAEEDIEPGERVHEDPITTTTTTSPPDPNKDLHISRHDKEAQRIARQSREWAHRVLRREDIEVYMFRLMLEYARICDDNRDRVGYDGDGTELEGFDNGEAAKGWGLGKWPWGGKSDAAA